MTLGRGGPLTYVKPTLIHIPQCSELIQLSFNFPIMCIERMV